MESHHQLHSIPADKIVDSLLIGDGGFSSVYKARHIDWGYVAVKTIKNRCGDENTSKTYLAEIDKHINLRHQNIVQFMGVIDDETTFAIVMEYLPHGSLDKFIERHPGLHYTLKLWWAHQISLGVNYLHTRETPIIHRDIKLPNVLVGEGFVPKITDFGVSQWKCSPLHVNEDGTISATASHVAPEVFLLIEMSPTTAHDAYSFAILLWELFIEEVAFCDMSSARIARYICDGKRPPTNKLPRQMVQIVCECWSHKPHERPSFGDLKVRLEEVLQPVAMEAEQAKMDLTQRVHYRSNPQSVITASMSMDGGSMAPPVHPSQTMNDHHPNTSEVNHQNPVNLAYPEPNQAGMKGRMQRPTSNMPVQRSSNTDMLATDMSAIHLEGNIPPVAPPVAPPAARARDACPQYGTVDLHPTKNFSHLDHTSKHDVSQMVLDQVSSSHGPSQMPSCSPEPPPKNKLDAAEVILSQLGQNTCPNALAAVQPDLSKPSNSLDEDTVPGSLSSMSGDVGGAPSHLNEDGGFTSYPPSQTNPAGPRPAQMAGDFGVDMRSRQNSQLPPKSNVSKSKVRAQTDSQIYSQAKQPSKPLNSVTKDVIDGGTNTVYNLSNVSGPVQIGNNNVMISGNAPPFNPWTHSNRHAPRLSFNNNTRGHTVPMPTKIEAMGSVLKQEVKDIMSKHLHDLATDIKPAAELYNSLYKWIPDCILPSEVDRIKKTNPDEYSQATSLVKFMMRRTNDEFIKFCKVLIAVKQRGVVEKYFSECLVLLGTSYNIILEEVNLSQADTSRGASAAPGSAHSAGPPQGYD